MLEIQGKYNTAKVFTDVIDEASINQLRTLCDQSWTKNSKIRVMPDVHAGAGCTIGTTLTITDSVVPNLVGVDIGCGVSVVQCYEKDIDLPALDSFIHSSIPSGAAIRDIMHRYAILTGIDSLRCANHVDLSRARLSVGTLGGGNHFIEVNKDDNDNIYIVVHSGSRHLGLEIAKYYQKLGYNSFNQIDKFEIEQLIQYYKTHNKEQEISDAIKLKKMEKRNQISPELAYICANELKDYIHDMNIAQYYASVNRNAIVNDILDAMNLHCVTQFTTVHNYIDTETMILRKGAVSAKLGEQLIIPINMRDGSLICTGKGNPDWNYSAPHGAGRLMSRTQAKKRFDIDTFKREMDSVYTTSVNASTLDECPMAYKNMEDIVNNIGDTVDIVNIIKPIYNFKAGE